MSVRLRQRGDLLAQLNFAVCPTLTAQRASTVSARLSQPLLANAPHQQPAHQRGHHVFRNPSFITPFSKTCSASSYFRRMLCATRSLNRLELGTLMPPNLLPHR